MLLKNHHTFISLLDKKISFLVLSSYLLLLLPSHGQGLLSDGAFASLLTCGDGAEVETFFGHTAVRVCDTAQGYDYVYNYGTYDFDQPHFYWTFTRGNLNYCLSRSTYAQFIQNYIYEGRAVYEQRLRLSQQECENLFLLLENNHQPEYRYYRYDFFRDNCATRPRDLIEATLGHRTPHYVPSADPVTYRSVMYDVTAAHLWWRLAFDIVLGIPTDHICDTREQMFAPQLLMGQMAQATLDDGARLTDETVQLLPKTAPESSGHTSPLVMAWCLLIVVLAVTLLQFRYGWRLRWMDILLEVVGLFIALLLLFLWFGTNHHYTNWNLNLLWASPLWLYLLIRGGKSRVWVIILQQALLMLALLVTLMGWPQHLNSAVIPITLIYFIRLTVLLRQQRQQIAK